MNQQQRVINAADAVPMYDEPAASLNAIYMRQKRPSLSKNALREMLDAMVEMRVVERIQTNRGTCYRRSPPVEGLAKPRVPTYNGNRCGESALDANVDLLAQAIYPLRFGKPVLLWMDDPRMAGMKNFRGAKRKLIVISPGPITGLPAGLILISIVGSGSCVIRTDEFDKIANLVLAGVPAKLANALVAAIRKVLKE